MNPQTWDKDVASIEPGGYLFYDSTKPMPASKFREDITVIGVPLTAIATANIPIRASANSSRTSSISARCRRCSTWTSQGDREADRRTIQEQGEAARRQQACAASRPRLGAAEPAMPDRACKLKRADEVGDRIFIEGNAAAALGAVYGGATVCAWYPITPSSSLADAFTCHCKRLRHRSADKKDKVAIVQGEDELASIGIVIGAAWNGARAFTATSGPGISLMQEFLGLSYFAEIPAVSCDVQRAGPSTGHADAHPAVRHPQMRLRLARRHQARPAPARGPGRSLRIRRPGVRSCGPVADAGLCDARSRNRHEPPAVPSAEVGRQQEI